MKALISKRVKKVKESTIKTAKICHGKLDHLLHMVDGDRLLESSLTKKDKTPHENLITVNKSKLIWIGIKSLSLIIIFSVLLNLIFFKVNWFIVVTILLLPVISAFLTVIINGKVRILRELAYIKYFKKLSPIFFYDPVPFNYRHKCADELYNQIQEGDIILRRHDSFLDGLVLLQTSYFSHAAIVVEKNEYSITLMHCVGSTGVTPILLEDFIKCDDIAVLRLCEREIRHIDGIEKNANFFGSPENHESRVKTDKITQVFHQKAIPGSGPLKDINIHTQDTRAFILSANKVLKIDQQLTAEELKIYDDLFDGKPVALREAVQVVKKVAIHNKKSNIKYDFNFNFIDVTTMSCVEFVWFCYKSLFPYHQVKRRPFTYFGSILTYILVPDLFLESRAFKVVYNSIYPDSNNKSNLLKYCKARRIDFWQFVVQLFLTMILLIALTAWIMAVVEMIKR
jgi:hypothetical protein